jgi:hypothetical protein
MINNYTKCKGKLKIIMQILEKIPKNLCIKNEL